MISDEEAAKVKAGSGMIERACTEAIMAAWEAASEIHPQYILNGVANSYLTFGRLIAGHWGDGVFGVMEIHLTEMLAVVKARQAGSSPASKFVEVRVSAPPKGRA